MPAARLVAWFSLGVAASGCVSPHLDGLSTAECAVDEECGEGRVCLAGACAAPLPPVDGAVVDEAVPDVGVDDGVLDMMAPPDMRADAGCVAVDEVCNGVDDDCDEVVDEGDPGALCALDGVATAACVGGACAIEACAADRADADGVAENGCECLPFARYFRVIGEAAALEEPAGLDLDCDGAPGAWGGARFVSAQAAADGDGSAAAPWASIDEAIAGVRAGLDAGERQVLIVGEGLYRQAEPSVVVGAGGALHLIGGFSYDAASGWRRSGGRSRIQTGADGNPAYGTMGDGVLVIDGIELRPQGAARPAGVRAEGCGHLELAATTLVVGGLVGPGSAEDGARVSDAEAPESAATAGGRGGDDGAGGGGGENAACRQPSAGGAGGRGVDLDVAMSGEAGRAGSAPTG
ncbi:MAG: hypothetical protein H6705_14730 [Myxococcales bacterium]|nr:hypothetical protein [Myxococcales bacterium]